MIKNIIREVAPEACDFSYYFDNDGLTERGGDYCYNLFIISNEGWGRISGFNIDEYKNIQDKIDHILDGFQDVEDKVTDYDGRRYTYKDIMQEYGIDYNSRKCHALKEWAKDADTAEPETVAAFLTITTGKKWDTDSVHGYCQGDYVDLVYCQEHYKNGVENYGEIWLGCAKEFCVIDVEDYQEPEEEGGEPTYTEGDAVYGYIVADCEAWRDDDYKRIVCKWAGINEDETRLEMIEDSHTYTKYSYRVA